MAMPDPYNIARVPPMGWNSLYVHYLDVSEQVMKDAADQLIALGLRDLGYKYVNIDDCWMATTRNETTQQLQANTTTFPNGMEYLAKYMHDRQLMLGIYSSAGTMTCTKFPGSVHYEYLDAQTFANWGIDYIKYDNCYGDGTPDIVRHSKMRNAILATSRPMIFSICNGGNNHIWRWAHAVGHLYRSTVDIQRNWPSIYRNYWNNQRHVETSILYSTNSRSWSDPDMLQLGNGGLSLSEERSQFGLWVMAKAPLLLSTRLDRLSNDTLSIISNHRLIQLHQNPNYPPATCFVGCRFAVNNDDDNNNDSGGDDDTNKTWPLPYSILATREVRYGDPTTPITTATTDVVVAIVVNWSDNDNNNHTKNNSNNQTLTMYAHDIGVVPVPGSHLVVTDLWTGAVIMDTTIGTNEEETETTTTTRRLVDERNDTGLNLIAIDIPALGTHDNVIYQFVITTSKNNNYNKETNNNGVATAIADLDGMLLSE